jgi:serine/threonine-protein kinase
MEAEKIATRSSALPPGRAIGPYTVGEILGEGASGIVYAARDKHGARVALKVIHRELLADRQIFGRFRREAAILKRLEGEHLAKLLDFVDDDGLLAIALEYVEGTSLETLLKEGPLPLERAIEITLQICAGLGSAHAAGVIHRDLKPANVLLRRPHDGSGEPIFARVVDFGLAKVVHGEPATTGLTEENMIFGTPEYMAPEQARGDEVDSRCDLYAAGVMLYEMSVGKVPFKGRTPIATMTAHLTEVPPSPRASAPGRALPPALEVVVLRALAKDPKDRYPTARAFAEALAAARDPQLVIQPKRVDDPVSLGVGDTDLHMSTTTALRQSPTPPSDSGPVGASDAPIAREPGGKDRWVWAIVAILAAAIGVTIGVIVGGR